MFLLLFFKNLPCVFFSLLSFQLGLLRVYVIIWAMICFCISFSLKLSLYVLGILLLIFELGSFLLLFFYYCLLVDAF